MIFYIFLVILVVFLGLGTKFWLSRRGLLKKLHGRHVFITGGSKGIGFEMARIAIENGANVTILARKQAALDHAKLELIKASVPSEQKVLAFSVDVCESVHHIQSVVNDAQRESGPIDLLACCAGTAVAREFEDTTDEQFRQMMSINYFGTVNSVKAALPSLRQSNDANILLFSSLAGLFGLYGYTAYSASKFAVVGFAESLAMELAGDNISVTVSFPPDTDTPGFEIEQQGKPELTKAFSDEGGLESARTVAEAALCDTLDRQFSSTVGLNGKVLGLLCSSMMPTKSYFLIAMECLTMGALRVFGLQFVLSCHRQVRQSVAKRRSSKAESNRSKKSL